MRRQRAAVALLAAVTVAGCSGSAPPQGAQNSPRELAARVQVDAMVAHLQKLQDIADAHDGNRADGTTGFEASADYVADVLRHRGFEVTTPEFERLDRLSAGEPTLTVGGRAFTVDQASLLLQTPVGGLSGPVLAPTALPGCVASDYPSGVARGGIAVADDSTCSVVDKQAAAAAAGAAALVVVSAGGRNGGPAGLFTPGYYEHLSIPVAVAGPDAGAALRRAAAPVRLVLDARTVTVKSRNVLAQTRTGDTHNVVMVGAPLDSATSGPGVNDTGPGVAALLETAMQLGPAPGQPNAVRFAFWGGSKEQSAGSLRYLAGLDIDRLDDIALYLDTDDIGAGAGASDPDRDTLAMVDRDALAVLGAGTAFEVGAYAASVTGVPGP